MPAPVHFTGQVGASTEVITLADRAGTDACGVPVRDHCGVRRTVLIVDDHQSFREMASLLLVSEGFDVVGEAADGESAVAAVDRLRPDVVLLDVQLPDADGFVVAEQLEMAGYESAVVLVSSRDADSYGDRIASSPARAFLTKQELSGAALAIALA